MRAPRPDSDLSGVRLVHITTIPLSLIVLVDGQAGCARQRGLDVYAISSPGELLEEFRQREGVPVIAVEMTRRIAPLKDLAALVKLWRELRRLRPDIVHAHTPKGGMLGTLAAWLAQVPVRIYHLHGLRFTTSAGLQRRLLRLMEQIACRLASRVLCVSHSAREKAIEEKLCSPQKICVLLNGGYGIDARVRFNPARLSGSDKSTVRRQCGIPTNALVVGYIGRVVRDKGIIELAGAWRLLREEFPALHLMFVGPFEAHDPLPNDVQAMLRSDPRIHLTGFIPAHDIPALYAALDILVLPSYREGFPLSILEASAMRLPVIATRVVGCVDAVEDGVTGMLVAPRDARALADAVRRYVVKPDLRTKHGQAGRRRVLRDFRPEAIWEAVYQEYARLLAARTPVKDLQ